MFCYHFLMNERAPIESYMIGERTFQDFNFHVTPLS